MNELKVNSSHQVTLFENLLTIPQLSAWLQVPEKTIQDWVYKRQIPFKKVGRLVRFKKTEIEHWINLKEDSNVH
jgi:excisionase family DNA binding protein